MTGHVYQLSANFRLPLEDLRDYLEHPDLDSAVEDIEIDRRNNVLLVTAVAADESLSKYTPTAQLKAKIEEKRVYEDETQRWNRGEEEEVESELVTYASFSGGREAVLQNTALRYPMFRLLCEIAALDVEGTLTAITADGDKLEATRYVDGKERPASVEVVEQSSSGETASVGVDWSGNQYID